MPKKKSLGASGPCSSPGCWDEPSTATGQCLGTNTSQGTGTTGVVVVPRIQLESLSHRRGCRNRCRSLALPLLSPWHGLSSSSSSYPWQSPCQAGGVCPALAETWAEETSWCPCQENGARWQEGSSAPPGESSPTCSQSPPYRVGDAAQSPRGLSPGRGSRGSRSRGGNWELRGTPGSTRSPSPGVQGRR